MRSRTTRRAALRTTLLTGLLAALLVPLLSAPGAARAADVDALSADLAAATAETAALGAALERAAAADGGLRVALERLEDERTAAQARLDARVREVFIARRPDPLGGLTTGLAAASLRRLADQGASAAVRVDAGLVNAVAVQSDAARDLQARATAFRTGLRARAAAALEAQERARVLLARAETELAARQVAARARAAAASAAEAAAAKAAAAAEQARLAAEAARLASARSTLDDASAAVTSALTPAQTRRGSRAQQREAPLIALAEAAGSGYPAGWGPTGQVLTGPASWYGPGFVGSPTASGAPYDPERLTCAHKSLPLGTLLRVSSGGRTVSCLLNDRGPYVGPRILDMSRAGSRALGYNGVAEVVIEVLAPQ